jgi:hypothetical protein
MKIISVLFLTILCFGCGSMPKTAISQPGVVPAIMELSPNNARAGGPAIILTVNGSGFASSAMLNFNLCASYRVRHVSSTALCLQEDRCSRVCRLWNFDLL